ncbi:MAG: F0F1 ATP synthase subunit alpha [Clostridiales bacterium]|nr:F0F1 ATP synthase subunit alpha [Oscillospiraceae bacterium]MBR0396176.1 F0F1 ATP synthase subunit alpha [Clostridiales bacterium]MBR2597133.1 F0F1 ATP synthase subunit alpha [Clostridiales bacterium]
MSNNPSDNNEIKAAGKAKSRGPSLRIETAGDIPEEKLTRVAAKFAEVNEIEDYRLSIELREDLIGGFIIYFQGSRYDYSVKGQLARIGSFIKRTRSIDGYEDGIAAQRKALTEDFPATKVKKDLETALEQFPESNMLSIDNVEIFELTDEELDKRVENAFVSREHKDEIGRVAAISDGVASVTGLRNCMLNELIYFASGATGIAMNLEKTKVGVVLLTGEDTVVESMTCKRTMTTCSVPVGMGLLGRVVDALGHPIDGKGVIRYTEERPVESPAPSIIDRAPVDTPLFTGITAIDALTPIGRGQRELIIGDRQTGKTSIALDTIINQKNENVICVYVPIGQKMANIVATAGLLEKRGALDYTVIVAASASESAAMQYIAPFSACAIAEKFMYDYHKDVLIVYDDLSKHAQAYRAISLLLRRPPGREAYPGDVFYLHSRLLERAAKLSDELGGGSITALPIVETQGNDISAYIPTNVISITDGQIYLSPELFFSGQRPAVNVGLSVSRVGGAAQTKAVKKVAGPLRISLAQAREMASFSQFGSDLDENTQLQIKRGVVLNEVLKQERFSPLTMAAEVILLYCATSDKFNFLATEDITEFYTALFADIRLRHPNIFEEITDGKVFTDEIKSEIDSAYEEYKETFLAEHEEYVEDY